MYMKTLAPLDEHLQTLVWQSFPCNIGIVFMGPHGEERAKGFQRWMPYTLYLPHKTSPYRYRWPLYQVEVYLVDTGISGRGFVRQCIMCFFSHGARLIHYFSKGFSQTFRKEPDHG